MRAKPAVSRQRPSLTGSVELVDVPELESVQGDGLIHHSEGASLLQQLLQLLVLLQPQGVLLRTEGLLHGATAHGGDNARAPPD